MIRSDIIDIRYVTKTLFLCLVSLNFGNTFDCLWLGIVFALYFLFLGCVNSANRRDFVKRPKYKKLPAYIAIVPLALYWVMTPGVTNGVNPTMVFIPGLYLLYLTALQERSRGNGGYEVFVNFNSMVVLLCSAYHGPRGSYVFVLVGLLLILFSNSRRGTALYKYVLFLVLFAALGAISYGGWKYWKDHRSYDGRWASEYALKNQMMGFDPVVALGSFGKNFNSKYNNQVVLRVWDSIPSKYMVAARYVYYAGGAWKLPKHAVKTMEPAYYVVDYSVMEIQDSITRTGSDRVWVQSTLDNFGFLFAPYGAVGFSAKDVDSLHYYAGGMVTGLKQKGSRSDWYYYPCGGESCGLSGKFSKPDSLDLEILPLYKNLVDSVAVAMNLQGEDSLVKDKPSGMVVLQKIQEYFNQNFTYSLDVPELDKRNIKNGREDPIHVFWRTRRGYCEYYATLSVLTLRRLGFPARYVSGFARPERTSGSPYSVFRRKNAHSWVDVYVDGQWYVFDPTPVVLNFEDEKVSWFANFGEGAKARFARWMHYLKEGQWRTSVDRWQAIVEQVSESSWTYGILFLLVGGLVGYRIYVVRRKKSRAISAKSLQAKEWANKLSRAEYLLSRVGFERVAGETVGSFLNRIQDKPLEGAAATARKTLEAYEANRWKL